MVSKATVLELMRVLNYSKFRLSEQYRMEALALYLPYCTEVEIVNTCPVLCRDVKDQPLLDLAQSGKADLLITDDEDLLALAGQTAFLIETPEAYRLRLEIGHR